MLIWKPTSKKEFNESLIEVWVVLKKKLKMSDQSKNILKNLVILSEN